MSNTLAKSGPLLRRALGSLTAALGSTGRFERSMRAADGGMSLKEGRALAESARAVSRGVVVGIGSCSGRSAIALTHGLRESDRSVYCIDARRESVGLQGEGFDRGGRTEQRLQRLDRPSAELSESWHEPIGLLFLDGEHGLDAIHDDFRRWYPRVLAGGVIAIDETRLGEDGATRLLREILPSRHLRLVEKVGRISFLQKLEHLTPCAKDHRRFLVACHDLTTAGGLLRFERVGRELAKLGDELAFVCLGDPAKAQFRSEFPVLSLAEASTQRWDVTMVPGQGFPKDTIRRFAELVDRRFGQRIQHVLNDQSKSDGFLEVNRQFQPHAVLFNTRAWTPGSYTDFAADRFATIEGAVDVAPFQTTRERSGEGFHVGGVSKEPMRGFWKEFALRMPAHWTLHLFGTDPQIGEHQRVEYVGRLAESDLPGFYAGLDALVQAESYAGWANSAAEAMAAKVPVVCSPAGTLAFAEHGDTARVVATAEPQQLCADVITELEWIERQPADAQAMVERAAERIAGFDWPSYTERLRALCEDDGRSHYSYAPELGLQGKWPLQGRLEGLEEVLLEVKGKSVLDLGCAEGFVARACLDHGAEAVHGFELDPSRVATCLELNPEPRACFAPASLAPWDQFVSGQGFLREAYDAVFYLGIHHHLPARQRRAVLEGALQRCRDLFVVRTPVDTWESCGVDAAIRAQGFELVTESDPSLSAQGRFAAYRRAVADPKLSQRDLRLVSFPKSGRTWIRFALTELGVADQICFEHDGFEYNDGGKPALDFDPSPRWDKCHRADRVVYMSRDPRDVIVSLFHQVTGRFKDFFAYEGDLSAFIRDPYFGASNLHGFQRMWQGVVDAGLAEHVTYEQAHEDFESTLRKILDAFGFECSDEAIREAAEAAAFDNMKAVESSKKFDQPWLRPRNEAPKVRKGKVGGYRSEMPVEDQDYLDQVYGA